MRITVTGNSRLTLPAECVAVSVTLGFTGPDRGSVVADTAAVTDRVGLRRSMLRERIGITPACGLAGATPQWARTAVELAQKVADAFAEDPDAI